MNLTDGTGRYRQGVCGVGSRCRICQRRGLCACLGARGESVDIDGMVERIADRCRHFQARRNTQDGARNLRPMPFLPESRDDKMCFTNFVGIPDRLAGLEMNGENTVRDSACRSAIVIADGSGKRLASYDCCQEQHVAYKDRKSSGKHGPPLL